MKIDVPTISKYYILHVKGLVQGVGFRPFVYRLAKAMKLNGWVENRNNGVFIKVSCSVLEIKNLEEQIWSQSPPAAQIHSINIKESKQEYFDDFRIIKSLNVSTDVTQVSPDIAVCSDCLNDMEHQKNRRDYPFVNCTNCGPRFSIIKELPYDRPLTTMYPFVLCEKCKTEYENVLDRRFHAQPIACNFCGPTYNFMTDGKRYVNFAEILEKIAMGIDSGNVYAIKGVGGFHLMCDAQNENAVDKIRQIKKRDGKPLAIMTSSVERAKLIADISIEEELLLTSWKRPIVLLKYKSGLSSAVSNGLNRAGVMLPYMPLHFMLFEKLSTPYIVLTSGNISDEPIIIDNNIASFVFDKKVDGVVVYNRDIFNRVDDSVCTIINSEVRINRRSRGYAPQPIITDLNTEGIFAAGAELVNSFCMGKGNQAILSQYLGDLKNIETLEFYEETFSRFAKLFRFKPQIIGTDLHPNYLSSQFAQKLSEEFQVPLIKIQHHHAHLASVLASNNLNSDTIGVCFDGIGLGAEGNIWGAEFMLANLVDYKRLYHFEYIPLPGGDKASKEPWRMAISYLFQVYGHDLMSLRLPIFNAIEKSKIANLIQLLKKRINTPLASSAGRLFDAVSSLIGLTHFNTFQAEAPMRLESLIDKSEKGSYYWELKDNCISFNETIKGIVADLGKGISNSVVSTKFHNTLIDIIVSLVEKISFDTKLNDVILSGGTFQNIYLTENVENILRSKGFIIHTPKGIPVNDQGIALGQMAIVAAQRKNGVI